MKNKPQVSVGDKITVMVGDKSYDTIIAPDGVQRFPINTVVDYMFRYDNKGRLVDYMNPTQRHTQMLDLNALCIAFHHGKFDKREYAELLMGTGYSVCGFAELNEFKDWYIENSLWQNSLEFTESEEVTLTESDRYDKI